MEKYSFLKAGLILCLFCLTSFVNAQPFDARPKMVITPFTSGGSSVDSAVLSLRVLNNSSDSVYLKNLTFVFVYDIASVTTGAKDTIVYHNNSTGTVLTGVPLIIHGTSVPLIKISYAFTPSGGAIAPHDSLELGTYTLKLLSGHFIRDPYFSYLYNASSGNSSMTYQFNYNGATFLNNNYYRWIISQASQTIFPCSVECSFVDIVANIAYSLYAPVVGIETPHLQLATDIADISATTGITIASPHINTSMPSDTTLLVTGDLYFDGLTGIVHRKY